MTRIVIIDHGMGNLCSVTQTLMTIAPEANVRISAQADGIRVVDHVVLPEQSTMPGRMTMFDQSGLRDAVLEVSRSKSMLGVCVGKQMLPERSTEARPGQQYIEELGFIKGDAVCFNLDGKLQPGDSQYKVPQMD